MFIRDLLERVVWTFIQSFLGVLAVDQALLDGDLGAVKVAAAAGAAAVASVIKGVAASRLGDKGTASTVSVEKAQHSPRNI